MPTTTGKNLPQNEKKPQVRKDRKHILDENVSTLLLKKEMIFFYVMKKDLFQVSGTKKKLLLEIGKLLRKVEKVEENA